MTKKELASELAFLSGISTTHAQEEIETLMKIMTEALVAGENIHLRGFGTFRLVERKAKRARNIHACTTIDVPAHKVVKFVPCPGLKNAVKWLSE